MNELKAWPFVEARRIYERTQHKDVVVFETGYGPSGCPHIGTFGEVARTTMVMHAFHCLYNKPTRLIVFSDDMDALRKVPDNVPNQEMMQEFIGVPLTSIPDPFGTHESFAHHNNAMLRSFLDQYGFEYEFMSSTECYRNGMFNNTLLLIAEHLNEIKNLVTCGYKQDRRETYCPFLPIHNGHTYHDVYNWKIFPNGTPEPFLSWSKNIRTNMDFGCDDRVDVTTSIFNGNVKCQWKVDWAMRWIALGVDYEMHGKDLIDSAAIGQSICKLLGQSAPLNFMYELFLDENGEKISKSRGNGLNLSDWWHYSTREVLSYYMFQNPRKARKLHFDVIPQATDDYIKAVEMYISNPSEDNVAWHVNNGNVPTTSSPITFAMLLNLVSITNTNDPQLIWKYIRNYRPDVTPEKYPFLDELVARSINYYEDIILPNKQYRIPSDYERNVLQTLRNILSEVEPIEELLTTVCYDVGKSTYGIEKLRDYFQMVYEVLMGQSSGPRLPIFIMLYGVQNTIDAIDEKLKIDY